MLAIVKGAARFRRCWSEQIKVTDISVSHLLIDIGGGGSLLLSGSLLGLKLCLEALESPVSRDIQSSAGL